MEVFGVTPVPSNIACFEKKQFICTEALLLFNLPDHGVVTVSDVGASCVAP